MSYLSCELHCHTFHSDGRFSPTELQQAAKENGLSLIALTDHNTFSGCAELDDNITPAIPGIEWTTYYGHILVLGAKGFVDWRNATPDNIDEKLCE
ncbi:MAG: CehA/McbA family metallohydrolase, partial [Eubacterium sp.]|nr:CehA/McbA family metallohydrolase [Eubacterium sp.]